MMIPSLDLVFHSSFNLTITLKSAPSGALFFMDFISPPDKDNIIWRIKKSDSTHVYMILESSGDHTWIEIEYLVKYPWYSSLLDWLSG